VSAPSRDGLRGLEAANVRRSSGQSQISKVATPSTPAIGRSKGHRLAPTRLRIAMGAPGHPRDLLMVAAWVINAAFAVWVIKGKDLAGRGRTLAP
jgi:hypothetical protein